MGANAVTTVPVYVSGEVLTAADLNITNSGIPVFADSTARDAAFGGAGEKTLAEGQFAYLEDTNATQYYDSSGWITVNLLAAINSAEVLTSQTTTSTSYTDLATVGPAVTVTTGTSAIVLITTQASPSVQGPNACMSCAVSGATTIAASDSFRAVGGDHTRRASRLRISTQHSQPVATRLQQNIERPQVPLDSKTAHLQFGRFNEHTLFAFSSRGIRFNSTIHRTRWNYVDRLRNRTNRFNSGTSYGNKQTRNGTRNC